MRRISAVGLAGALALSAGMVATPSAQAATPTSYSVMLLNPLAGHEHAYATGLNNLGDVVGTAVGINKTRAVMWNSRSGIATNLATSEIGYTEAGDISDARTVAATRAESVHNVRAFTITGTKITWIETDALENRAEHISASGAATLTGDAVPYLISTAGVATALPLPTGKLFGSAEGISDDGRQVVGHAGANSSDPHRHDTPIRWSNGVAKVLSAPSSAYSAEARGVNNAGVAVGCVASSTTASIAQSWNTAGAATALPALGAGQTCAEAVNEAGTIVGESAGNAAIWIDNKVHNLNDLLPNTDGFTLVSASDVNASGQIVGTARLADGSSRGFIATPSNATTIYTTPGLHEFNGRQWKTTCEPYSQTMRCRTEIVATVVRTINGQHTRVTDWAFNNLTYLPSDRALWAGNPLGNTGTWTASDGRQWRTECDTAATGRNGCRSYARVTVVTATPNTGGGYTYTSENKFVFNNIVQFHA